jgi:putative endonuclease
MGIGRRAASSPLWLLPVVGGNLRPARATDRSSGSSAGSPYPRATVVPTEPFRQSDWRNWPAHLGLRLGLVGNLTDNAAGILEQTPKPLVGLTRNDTPKLTMARSEDQKAEMKTPSTNPWFVYILRCADGSLYTGITKDVKRRCQQHNDGTASRYTRSRRPTKLVWQEAHLNRGLAQKREAAIKGWTRREKLEMIRLRRTKLQDRPKNR